MRISRVHVDQELSEGRELQLPTDTAHYLVNVLRLKAGQPLLVFNGRSDEFEASLSSPGRKQATITLGQVARRYTEPRLSVHLGLALIKSDRFDWAVQKCTELGVAEITPLISEFSEVRIKDPARQAKKLAHWQRVAASACEQSGNLHLPTVNAPETLAEWTGKQTQATGLLLSPDSSPLAELARAHSYRLLVGPEGGFSDGEEAQALADGYFACGMGPRILRAETATVAALAALQSRFGDLA